MSSSQSNSNKQNNKGERTCYNLKICFLLKCKNKSTLFSKSSNPVNWFAVENSVCFWRKNFHGVEKFEGPIWNKTVFKKPIYFCSASSEGSCMLPAIANILVCPWPGWYKTICCVYYYHSTNVRIYFQIIVCLIILHIDFIAKYTFVKIKT